MVFKWFKLQWNHFWYIKKKTPHFLTPKKHKIKNTIASHHPEFKKRSITVFCVWRSSFCVLNAAASKHILVTRISRRQDTEERKANGAIWGITGRGFIWRTTQQVEISDSGGGRGGRWLEGEWDWPVWSITITSFSLSQTGFSRLNRKQVGSLPL